MLRSVFVHALCLIVCLAFVTGLSAAVGVVVKPPEKGNVEIKIGGKVEKVPLRGVKVTDAKAKRLVAKNATTALKADVKVDVTKQGKKVTAIQIKK